MSVANAPGSGFGLAVKMLEVPGFRLRETLYDPAQEIATDAHLPKRSSISTPSPSATLFTNAK